MLLRAAPFVVAALLAACAAAPPAEESLGAASTETAPSDSSSDRFRIDPEPVWRWIDDGSQLPVRLDEQSVAGRLVMATGRSSSDRGPGVAVADAESGAFLWELESLGPVKGFDIEVEFEGYLGAALAGSDDAPVVVIPYYARGCLNDACAPGSDQEGVLGLEARTGEVRWVSPIDESNRQVAGGRTSVPVVATGPDAAMYGDPIPVLDETRITVLDTADGAERWAFEGAWPEHVADELVAAWTGSDELTLLDLDTGKEIMTTSAPFGDTVVHSSKDLLALETRRSLRLIDPAGGSELTEIEGVRGVLVDAETGLVVFREPEEPTLFTSLAPGEAEPTASGEPLPADFRPRLAAGGHIFAHHSDDDVTIVVDRTGAALSDRLPGHPVALIGDLLILREGRVVTAYQRTEAQ